MREDFPFKNRYTLNDLVAIVRLLREPGGCPWDREQTHVSIRENFLEETYEVLEAIDTANPTLLQEELGDVLLQVVMHADMARADGQFTIDDVADGVCRKLIERHPHVFGEVTVSGSDEVLQNWDDIKRKSKSQPTQTDAINAIPKTFPALMKAQKVQGKAAKAGFDWRDPDGAFDKIAEESAELKRALAADGNVEEELGDLLFSCVNVARFCHVKAETALEKATAKFSRRFAVTEQLAAERGVDMKTAGLDVLDELWDEAKRQTD